MAACAGGLVAGLFEGASAGGERLIATIGLVCMVAVPALVIASCAVRAMIAAWRPQIMFEALREERGGMPRLAAWVGVAWLGALALAWAMFQGTWLLVSWTAFKPNSYGFLAPLLAVGSVLVIVALSRPCAELFTRLARAIDRRWQRTFPGTLLHPRIIVGGAIGTGLAATYLIWLLLVSRRMPHLDSMFLLGPLAATLVVVIVHATWTWPVRGRLVRRIAGVVVGAAAIAAIAFAIHVVRSRAEIALAIWAEEPISGTAVARLFDLEVIRSELPLDAFRPRERTPQHRDLVLVTFEGVRADRTPPYGGTAAMPVLAELAGRGTRFEWAFAPSNVTARSIPTMITGIAPNRVRGKRVETAMRLDPRHVVLAERLRAAGYDTAAFTCCAYLFGADARTGFARGLEHVAITDNPTQLAAAARGWLAARTSTRPLFLWIHARPSYTRDRERADDAERRSLYDASLATADAVLASIVLAFSERPVDRSPIFVVTSAHGEELGEHGQPFRADDLYNTQIRVPLVIAGPNVRTQVLTEPVGLVDLVPTLLELAGYHAPRGLDGRSLGEVAFGTRRPDASNPVYAAMFSGDRSAPSSSTVIRKEWKLIDTGSSLELYNLHADPSEKTNLAGQRTQTVTELRTILNARTKSAKTDPF